MNDPRRSQFMSSHFVLLLQTLVALHALLLSSANALAYSQFAEAQSSLATDTALPPAVPLQPGYFPPKERAQKNELALLMTKDEKTSKLDHIHVGGDDIKTTSTHEAVAALAGVDLGAGARVSLLHELVFRKAKTTSSALRRSVPREEVERTQQDALRVTIELVEGLTMGMGLRYIYQSRHIFGDLTTSDSLAFKTTLIGYGGGGAWQFKNFGFGYAYFPQLRGKTEVLGEEKIIVEPGFLSVDAYFRPADSLVFSLLNRRDLWEADDIDRGTTALDNNQTRLSLNGLDPDQYLLTDSLTMIGMGLNLGRMSLLKLSVGQEKGHFNFMDLMVYNRINVRQRSGDPKQEVTTNRLRAQVGFFMQKGLEISVGMGIYERKHEFPVSMNNGLYEASGKELMASVVVGL